MSNNTTYTIEKAHICTEKGNVISWKFLCFLAKKLFKILTQISVFAICFIFTCFIYRTYLIEISIENTISIGALLSTLGTSISSLANLYCNEILNRFIKNSEIMLKNQDEFQAKWEHRSFIKRFNKHTHSKFKYEYYILENPIIEFNGCNWRKRITIPTSKIDFYELPIIRNYFKLKFNRKKYRKLISFYTDNYVLKDILVWDNLTELYKEIIQYKFLAFLSFCGICIVINGLLFSFFYNSIISLINL